MKACIFDLDGVIVDTAKYHYLAWKGLAEELGFIFTEKDNERLKGVSRMASLDILLEVGGKTAGEKEKLEMAEKKNGVYLQYISKMTPEEILPGAKDLLISLRQSGIKTALGSASKNAKTILQQTGISELFDTVIDGNCVSNAKPDPEVFLNAANNLGVRPEACIVFEDALAGVEAAHNGGMKCIGIGDARTLEKADIVVSGLDHVRFEEEKLMVKTEDTGTWRIFL